MATSALTFFRYKSDKTIEDVHVLARFLIIFVLGTACVSTLYLTIRRTYRKWRKRMLRNVNKPTYFGSGHVLNSKINIKAL